MHSFCVQHTVVDQSSNQTLLLQHGECIQSLALGQKVGAFDILGTCEEIVEFGTCPEVWNLPPLLERNHDGEPLRQMRGGVQEVTTFAQSFDDEGVSGLRIRQEQMLRMEILTGCSPGSRRPFRDIVHRHVPALYSYCWYHC
jgi:hypothetical protein